jgi:SNF2 family DNA or RNA helicase
MLQPSLHARGARPYVYVGHEIDEVYAPGTQSKHGEVACAVDTAWRIEPILGSPKHFPVRWPGVVDAAPRARELAQQKGLTDLQQDGAAFLAERDYAVLMDPTGAGKTAQALIAAEARLSLGVAPLNAPAVLVICPALAKWHWEREVKRWTGHSVTVLESLRPDPDQLAGHRYVIVNYDILASARRRDAAGVVYTRADLPGWGALLHKTRFVIVVCDECHGIRGRKSQRTKAVKFVTQLAVVVWMMSATPMPNYLRDLWAQLDLMSIGLHGGYWDWVRAYCGATQGAYGWIDTGTDYERIEELRMRLGYYMLGRSKPQIQASWPEKRREIYPIDVKLTAPTVQEADDALERQTAVDKALRATARAKRPAVIEQAVEALDSGQKVVVFTYLREQAEWIAKGIDKALQKEKRPRPVYCANGKQTPQQRDTLAKAFREAEGPTAFVATIDSVGVAISLVGAELVLFADLLYEPWKLLQAEGRTHRFDSGVKVLIRYLVARGTIDEALEASIVSKLRTIEAALGTDADNSALEALLGTEETDGAKIVDRLFARLKAWGQSQKLEKT